MRGNNGGGRLGVASRNAVASSFRNAMSRIAPVLRALLLTAFLLSAGAVAAQTPPIGQAVAVTPAATGQLGGTAVTLLTGEDLYQGQVIATNTNGEVQIVFADDTHMVVGPNSTLQIETYLLRNANTVENFAVNALGGTFRFITGTSDHGAYRINTPTGTIGVRGTEFDFTVERSTGHVNVLVYDGIVVLCPLNGGECVELGATCSVGNIATVDLAARIDQLREARQLARQEFPYARFQYWLREDFQVEDPRGCLWPRPDNRRDPAENPEPSNSSSPSLPSSSEPCGEGGCGSESSGSESSQPGSEPQQCGYSESGDSSFWNPGSYCYGY